MVVDGRKPGRAAINRVLHRVGLALVSRYSLSAVEGQHRVVDCGQVKRFGDRDLNLRIAIAGPAVRGGKHQIARHPIVSNRLPH